jgi:hypothetical protein
MTAASTRLLFHALTIWGFGSPMLALAQEKVRRNVEIEWEQVPGARLYEIQIQRKDDRNAKLLRFKTKESRWGATVKPGAYKMQIRSYDDRGVPGPWPEGTDLIVKLPAIIVLEPKPQATVQANNPETHPVDLKWEPVPGARKYRVEIRSTSMDWSTHQEVTSSHWSLSVPVAQDYAWNVTPVDDRNEAGDRAESDYEFRVQGPMLTAPSLERPLNKFVREVRWSPSDHATHYSYELRYYDAQIRKWVSVESGRDHKEPELRMDIARPSGRYRLQVQAHGIKRLPSRPARIEFETKGGFRDLASLEGAELRETFSKPTHLYAIASYLITQIEYKSIVHEDNAKPTFKAVGGTGRLGMGYQSSDSNWGGFGIFDLSGFIINGKNYRFASMEAHVTRKLEFGQRGLLMVGSGLFSKELPIVRGSQTEGYRDTGKVRNIGPHAGMLYWMPLNRRLGMQVNGRIYYSAFGTASNGQSIESAISYQYGLLGSYRLTETWMGYAGYAHRTDQSRYKAEASDTLNGFADPGDINSVTINGDYLNLVLEYSF